MSMTLLRERSLAARVDAIDEMLWRGERKDEVGAEMERAAVWMASRLGKPGSYAGMFAPTATDLRAARVFTGERLTSDVQRRHILGEETCRSLWSMGVSASPVSEALNRANENMLAQVLSILESTEPSDPSGSPAVPTIPPALLLVLLLLLVLNAAFPGLLQQDVPRRRSASAALNSDSNSLFSHRTPATSRDSSERE